MGSQGTAVSDKSTLRKLGVMLDRRISGRQPVQDRVDELAELRKQLDALAHRQRSVELLLAGDGRGMARMPSPGNLSSLANELAAFTGDRASALRNVHIAFRLLVAFEAIGVGRIAGGTMNICGKLAAAPLLAPPNDEVLEIGTLYGMFGAAMLRMLERSGREPQFTIIDPLVGTQLQNGSSITNDASGTPVDERAVRTNLALAGAAGQRTRLHIGYSTDPAARKAISDRQYGLIVVDGDHSREGVIADLAWVEEIVAPGGVVILDDFGDAKWPGVQQAWEHHATTATRMQLLGRAASSGYLRAE